MHSSVMFFSVVGGDPVFMRPRFSRPMKAEVFPQTRGKNPVRKKKGRKFFPRLGLAPVCCADCYPHKALPDTLPKVISEVEELKSRLGHRVFLGRRLIDVQHRPPNATRKENVILRISTGGLAKPWPQTVGG